MNKQQILISIGIVLVVLALGIGGYWYFSSRSPDPGQSGALTSPFGFVGNPSTANKTLSLVLTDGTVVQATDFTKDNQPEWAGADSGYWVAGSEKENYLILYFAPDQEGGQAQFLISIYQEPIGANRRSAEAALKARLNLPESEICKLISSVSTGPGVSTTYDGINLGLSFCPGAVKLP